jgi:hypothetical protein
MLTPNAPLTALDRVLAYLAPSWALRRARDRRTFYLEAQRDLDAVRWVDGVPYTRVAEGEWLRVPGVVPRPPVAVGPGWRPSTFWPRLGPRVPAGFPRQ